MEVTVMKEYQKPAISVMSLFQETEVAAEYGYEVLISATQNDDFLTWDE